jgi:hypothetical protein
MSIEQTEPIKQTDPAFARPPYDAIQTDGCFWRTLLHAGELFTGKTFTAAELKHAYHYSIPDCMEDHRTPGQDRCYIKGGGHVEIIRIGFYMMGERNVDIGYGYRYDFDAGRYVIGNEAMLDRCNWFVSKCKMPTFNHFYESNRHGDETWNPGRSYSNELLSLRGFSIYVR